MKTINLNITGMTCASCSASVQRKLDQVKAITSASVNIVTEKAEIKFDETKIGKTEIIKIIEKAGYGIVNKKQSCEVASVNKIKKMRNTFLWSLLFGLPLLYLAMGPMVGLPVPAMELKVNLLIQFLLTTAIMVVNSHIYISGLKKLIARNPNMDSLVEIGTLAAYAYFYLVIALPRANK